MNILLITFFISALILIISRNINNLLLKYTNLSMHENLVIGFMLWLGLFFLMDYFMIMNHYEAQQIFITLFIISSLFIFLGFRKFRLSKRIYLFIILFVLIMIVSMKYRLGEQLGDNSYLTNLVTMNVNRLFLNSTDFGNGFKFDTVLIGSNKAYLSWYHFFSALLFAQQHLFSYFNLSIIQPYLIYVWTGNILFFVFSLILLDYIWKMNQQHSKFYFAATILFFIYWLTIYYHLVLGYYGSNFVSLFVSGFWILLMNSEDMKFKSIWTYILSLYAIAAMGNVGFITSAYLIFSYSIYEIIKRNQKIFLFIPFLLIPLFHWMYILNDLIPTKWLLPLVLGVSILSWGIHFIKPLKELIFKYILYILGVSLILWYGLAYLTSDNYWVLFKDFFAIKSNFDRLQDYFSFVSFNDSLRNIAFYFALGGLFLSDKTRKIGWMVLIIFLFFINPIVYPMLYPPLQWLYHRAYISIFNMFVIMMGIYGLFDYLLKIRSQWRYVFMVSWMLLLVPSTYQQITGYFHPIYKPGPDFNVIYKLENSEIEVLEKLRQIVDLEHYENAKVISQIYATTMYVPDVYQMYFNVYNRRSYFDDAPDEFFDPLYRIFYTPTLYGDDGPRLNAPVKETCNLLIANQVDFVIYDKTLSVYDKEVKDWMPTHWYARDCAEKVIENDRFIMYRFYWEH